MLNVIVKRKEKNSRRKRTGKDLEDEDREELERFISGDLGYHLRPQIVMGTSVRTLLNLYGQPEPLSEFSLPSFLVCIDTLLPSMIDNLRQLSCNADLPSSWTQSEEESPMLARFKPHRTCDMTVQRFHATTATPACFIVCYVTGTKIQTTDTVCYRSRSWGER